MLNSGYLDFIFRKAPLPTHFVPYLYCDSTDPVTKYVTGILSSGLISQTRATKYVAANS